MRRLALLLVLAAALVGVSAAGEPAPATTDTTPPHIALFARIHQNLLRTRRFVVSASCYEACSLTLAGTLRQGRATITLRGARRGLAAGSFRAGLALSRKGVAAFRRMLRRRRPVNAIVTAVAFDAARNRSSASLTVPVR